MKKFLLLLILPLLIMGCGAFESQSNELAICSSLPLSHRSPARYESMSRAIQQAIEEQRSITLGGQEYTLRYVSLDGATTERGAWDTAQEARNARAAISEYDCVAYIGTYNSGAAKISMPILNRVQMPMISPGNTYPGLTKPGTGIGDEPWIYSPLGPDRRNYCRVVPADDLQAPAAASYAANVLGVQRVFIFHDTELYGRGLAEIFARAAAEEGLQVVEPPLGVDSRTLNAGSLADSILADSPDLVYFGGETGNKPGEVLRALRERGYTGYFMGADAIAEAAFLEQGQVRSDDDKVFATLVGLPLEQLTGPGEAWLNNYVELYNEEPDPFAAPSYEAAQIVIQALQRVPATDKSGDAFIAHVRQELLREIKATRNYQGVLGEWSFDENCDTTDTTISMNQARAGQFDFVDLVRNE